jgi:hypothetical protein
LAGVCNCASAKKGWFCKHQVAAALVWRQRLAGIEPQIDRQSQKLVLDRQKRDRKLLDRHQRMVEFLRGLDRTCLSAKLVELAGDALGEAIDRDDREELIFRLLTLVRDCRLWPQFYSWREAPPRSPPERRNRALGSVPTGSVGVDRSGQRPVTSTIPLLKAPGSLVFDAMGSV